MEAVLQSCNETHTHFHFERSRLTQMFIEAVKYPLVVVCAGGGYGKTSAVHDFAEEYQAATIWIQLSERDNVGTRFWENHAHSMTKINEPFAKAVNKLGFPDTGEKLNQYFSLLNSLVEKKRRIIVMDDFHLIEDPSVINFLEHAFHNLPLGTSVILASRTIPLINISSLISKDLLFSINEYELRFTKTELSQYFRRQDISLQPDCLCEIMRDTEGWAFAINLIARSYQKAPGYSGYLRNAMKTNIFQLMEMESWNEISNRLQSFLICLSLIDHLSVDLIFLLARGDTELLSELERQTAYIRRDNYINAYLIHHLFLEFLCQKQDLLSENQKQETYAIAGDWCSRNDFKIDALAYYEKIGDYESIVSIFFELPAQVPQDIALYAVKLFSQTTEEAFDRVDYLAVMHVRTVICLGLWKESFELMEKYEKKCLNLPENDLIRNHTLGGIYYCWGIMRSLMCTIDSCYDFDGYFAKLDKCLSEFPIDPGQLANHPAGPWISLAGSSRKGAPLEYIDALTRAVPYVSHCFCGAMAGLDDLARGEFMFYQGDIHAAESHIASALGRARECRQFDAVHRALFYTLRIAIFQGKYAKAEQALKDMETQMGENEYALRFITYDIVLTWYYCVLALPEKVPDWLKDKFEPYGHASFIENFGNQAKAQYCYLIKNYPPLLAYMQEQKQRESVLFGRVEMLAMEACVHLKMKDKKRAFTMLQQAYETASPNGILLPFIEMGKDMRTLTAAALKEPGIRISRSWLKTVNGKSASYAKRQSHVIAEYKQANCLADIAFSPRQLEILTDLSHGLSRVEIASSRNLSINTVKMVINSIYAKLGAVNLADLIRIAVERKMI